MKKLVLLCVVMACTSACAVSPQFRSYPMVVDGKSYTYVVGQSYCPAGWNMMVVDRYMDGQLVARDAGFTDGILAKVLPAAVHGGLVAGGMLGAAALLPSDNVNVSQTGGNAQANSTSGSESSSLSSSNSSSSSVSSSKSTAIQSQSQGQSNLFVLPKQTIKTGCKPD